MQTNEKNSLQVWLRECLPDRFVFAHVNNLTGNGYPLPTASYAIRVLNLFVKLGLVKQVMSKKTRKDRVRHLYFFVWLREPTKREQELINKALQLWLFTGFTFSTKDMENISQSDYWIGSRNRTARYRMINRLIKCGALQKVGHGKYRWTL